MKIWIGIYQFKELGGRFTSELDYRYELHHTLNPDQSVYEQTYRGLILEVQFTKYYRLLSDTSEWKVIDQLSEFMINYFNNLSMNKLLIETEYHNWQVFVDVNLAKI